jgi:hypothetical protein
MLFSRVFLTLILLGAASETALAAKPTRFWNLTDNTVTSLRLAPAGTEQFGEDQTKADKDGAVDHDERLKLGAVASGTYDVKLVDSKGRNCLAKGIAIKSGEIFSIEEKQLSCTK